MKRRTSNTVKATPLVHTTRVCLAVLIVPEPHHGHCLVKSPPPHAPAHPPGPTVCSFAHSSIVFLVLHTFLLLDSTWGPKHCVCRFKRKKKSNVNTIASSAFPDFSVRFWNISDLRLSDWDASPVIALAIFQI